MSQWLRLQKYVDRQVGIPRPAGRDQQAVLVCAVDVTTKKKKRIICTPENYKDIHMGVTNMQTYKARK
jgi:hypothetical protein